MTRRIELRNVFAGGLILVCAVAAGTSPTAERFEPDAEDGAPARGLVLPEEHWLEGTSTASDMFPARVAPEASRTLLAEEGPAYLERIGTVRVLHLKGGPYAMGFQHGVLLKDEIISASERLKAVGGVAWDGDFGSSMREAWQRTSPHIPSRYKRELRGMADATGLSLEAVQGLTIFPELFHCSGFTVWGRATADGALLHGRVLDYIRQARFDEFAVVMVQEPDEGHAFLNVGYAGMIGSVTGMNDQGVVIGEMGGKGNEQWDGVPMTLLVRQCLEKGTTIEDVRRIMTESPRTCQYYYVISDAKAAGGRGDARAVAAEPDEITFLGANEAHPLLPRPLEDAVLLSADDRYRCLVDRVEKMYGRITPEVALDIMARGVAMKGNIHNALFKPKTLEVWVANSDENQPACNRPYQRLDFTDLLARRSADTGAS